MRRSEELSMDPAALVETRCLLLKLKRLINCWSILRTIALFFCWGGGVVGKTWQVLCENVGLRHFSWVAGVEDLGPQC